LTAAPPPPPPPVEKSLRHLSSDSRSVASLLPDWQTPLIARSGQGPVALSSESIAPGYSSTPSAWACLEHPPAPSTYRSLLVHR
jgi:hypothetical protein